MYKQGSCRFDESLGVNFSCEKAYRSTFRSEENNTKDLLSLLTMGIGYRLIKADHLIEGAYNE